MIYLLCWVGCLEDAQALMKNMPFEPDAIMWMSDVGKMRVTMRERCEKLPGFTWIEVQNKVHIFLVCDSMHPVR
ncbi:pentatricopeptide repeat-containing protein [Cinnamomum micranthum f. kanehirae]|uniref:Pentatricopeptide repeat-containing protein n=1 Tax=Cinnamomum micranthum f. kanehirae TaxID=337451 RepID=A0A3S3NYA9_9MAGN|nr:pentatricopeptide repeat-containing protein [Cinnamomum micranthum f. kanehirae]